MSQVFDKVDNDSDTVDNDNEDRLAAVREEMTENTIDDVGMDDA